MKRVYGISKDQLKKLRKAGDLVPNVDEKGAWSYPVPLVGDYWAKNKERFAKVQQKQLKHVPKYSPKMPEFIGPASTESRCDICGKSLLYYDRYCGECSNNLVAKSKVLKDFNLKSSQFDHIVASPDSAVKAYPYGVQQRYYLPDLVNALSTPETLSGKWSAHYLKCRLCGTTSNEHYGGGYCIECYPVTKEAAVLRSYMEGENLAKIGLRLGFSRERARQIFNRAIEIDLDRLGDDVADERKHEIRDQIELAYKQGRSARDFKKKIDDSYDQITETLRSNIILSEAGMLKSIGLPPSAMYLIEEEYPEFLNIIFENKNKWSWKYDHCRMCGGTEKKHKRWGYCEGCYTKSPEWREEQSRYRLSHAEEIRERNRTYGIDYRKRPAVKKRLIKKEHQKRFGSNVRREYVIKKSGSSCSNCGMSRADSMNKWGRDLSVVHIDGDVNNNSVSNLRVFCKICAPRFTKKGSSGQK